MIRRRATGRVITGWLAAATLLVSASTAAAGQQGRFLAKEDIVLLGIGLQAAPASQTVPVNIATIVSTYLQSPSSLPQGVPPFAPDAVVQATLRGPSYPNGLDLTAAPNTPFNIPPLGVAGLHTVDNIRLVSGGSVLLYGSPESVTINVIDKLLVTQVTARPLTADEIQQKGIVFDKSSFQAYNFAAAFAIQDQTINVSFPVLLPTLQSVATVANGIADIPSIPTPSLPSLQTIIPDTLKLQTQIPNLSVVGFTLSPPASLQDGQLIVPPIPGVVVIPGNIGFLDQFFSVMLMVGNVAPTGSNLVVTDLSASIALPPGNDEVLGSSDDPLRMAHTASGDSPATQPVRQPGPDGKLGTADDINSLGPGQSAQAEFLVEGLREGTHTITINMAGTLNGLPIGPVPISGSALGAVLVRNPTFTLTFTHPDAVHAGEPYTLDVTVSNTSSSPANFVSVSLLPQNLSGASLAGDSTQQVESIAPADSATVHFQLVSKVSGKVTAATLDSDQNVAGRFQLKSGVGELGVPVSPDSLVLPAQADTLPLSLRDAAIGMLGKAWAVATSPAAALPANIARFSQAIVMNRAVQVAEAGFRVSLHEPLPDSAFQLEMDFAGSDYARLSTVYPNAADLATAQVDVPAFDGLRRQSVRGDVLASSVAALLEPNLAGNGVAAFHRSLAEKIAYRPGHVSVVIGDANGPLPFNLTLLDSSGNQLGGVDATGKVTKTIPFGDYLTFSDGQSTTGEMALIAAPTPGAFTIRLDAVGPVDPATPFTLSVVVPDAAGKLRQLVYQGVTAQNIPALSFAQTDPYTLTVALNVNGTTTSGAPLPSTSDAEIVEPLPAIVGVVQQWAADAIACPDGTGATLFPGRVVGVLFNKEVTPASAEDGAKPQDIANYAVDGNAVVGVALQPGRRIAFLALRDPVGPFVARQLTISGVADPDGNTMPSQTAPIEATVTADAAVVSGRALQADGSAIAFGNVRLFYTIQCDPDPVVIGISSKSADVNGQYSWDYVLKASDSIAAIDPESGLFRQIDFTPARNGQRLNVDVVLLGRGTFTGRTLGQDGVTPLKGTSIRVTSLTDQSQYGATTDDQGRFTIAKIPVGNILIEAVNTAANAQITLSGAITLAGGTVTRDLTLLNVDTTQITVQHGSLAGHVFRSDGATPASGFMVVAYYRNGSQSNIQCNGDPTAFECAVAAMKTDAAGSFSFPGIIAGEVHVQTFDQTTLEQGDAVVVVPVDGSVDVIVQLAGGLGTVQGTVLDPQGTPVSGARVGGGLSLSTTDASGHFTLTDVPVGHRNIVAVSDQVHSTGQAQIDLLRNGDTVNVTVVLSSTAAIAGTVYASDGVTPVPNNKVYVFDVLDTGVQVIGTATTDQGGHYTITGLPLGDHTVSAFTGNFSDGNIALVSLKFNNQTLRLDLKFRGSGGSVTGTVFDSDGVTPLKARVGISGDRVLIAGGIVATGFQRVQNFTIVDTDLTTGRYSFSGLWAGDFTVSAAGQFSPDPISLNGTIPSAGAAVRMDLRLQATSRISGTVFQPDGVTPVGANVVVTYHSSAFKTVCDSAGNCANIPQGIQQENVVTDANGQYVLPIVNAGTFTLTAQDPATGKTAQINGSVRAGQQVDLPIRLLGIGQLTVQVLGSDSVTPIPGAKVEVRQLDYPSADVTLFADALGAAAFTGGDALSEGTFVVVATDQRNGLAGRASGKITFDGQQLTLKLYLYNASGTAFGTVFGPDGLTPVPNADVVISNSSGPLAFTVSDSAGGYSQDLIPLGPFTVQVFEAATARRGGATGHIDLDQEHVPVNITEAALGFVTGTVLESDSRQPLVGAGILLYQTLPSGQRQALQSTSGTDGTFSFPAVSVGPFSIQVQMSKNGQSGFAQVSSSLQAEGQTVDVPILVDISQPLFGRIQGTTFNPDGTPASGTQVTIYCPNCLGSGTVVTAAADGTFGLDHAQIGRFVISATSQTTNNSGSAQGQLSFGGAIADVPIVLNGLGQINGTVVLANGAPAGGAQVTLTSLVAATCGGSCVVFADASGGFSFPNVPAGRFNIVANDPVSGLSGTTGGSVAPNQSAPVRVVIQPSGSLHGRVLLSNGSPASGITGILSVGAQPVYVVTGADGTFTFQSIPLLPYSLLFQDPLGPGLAERSGTVTGDIELGDVTLNDTTFAVASTTPTSGAVGVARTQAPLIVFNEAVTLGTINATDVSMTASDGTTVPASLSIGTGGATVTLTPLSPLKDATRYSVRVTGVADALGRPLSSDYVFSFTTVDITPPGFVDVSPAASTTGVALASTVRVQYSEPVDPTKFAGAALTLSSPGGAVATRLDYLLGNTVLVLTPLQPLATGTVYHVHALPATDLSGNLQSIALDYTFTTTSLTPPQVLSLTASNNGSVITGTPSTVTANVGTQDVAFVDFYLNDVFSGSVRTAPFAFQFQANDSLALPGAQIKVGAIATDTSGIRGQAQITTLVAVLADQPPTVALSTSIPSGQVHNGDRVTVTVHAADDVGVAQVGFKAATGRPQDAAAVALTPALKDSTQTFAFNVPFDAAPGSTISIQASGVDTKGQTTQAAPASLTVLDSVAPTVTITGATTGTKVSPSQQTTVVVSAQDLGGVASITFTASGAATFTQTRTIAPAQNSAVTSFTFTVSPAALPGDSVTLSARATDQAGNVGNAANVLLPIADSLAPTIHLHTDTGRLDVVRGATVNLVAEVEDETAVARVDLTASGAISLTTSKAVSPPVGSAAVVFPIAIPNTLQPGDVVNVQATAVDTSNNVSVPASLSLTVESLPSVVFPPSAIVAAGANQDINVQLSDPAPTGGLTVSIATSDPNVASVVTTDVAFAAGDTSKTATLTGVSGGTATITGSIQGAPRGSMTVTVQGGVVSGTVYDPTFVPVAGAQVSVGQLSTTTDSNGAFQIENVTSQQVTVRVLDPATGLIGFATGNMNRPNGFVQINVVLLAAGTIDGTVRQADGQTPAGAGVKVQLFDTGTTPTLLSTTFTAADGTFTFPLVALGSYSVDATDVQGDHGRSIAVITASGQDLNVPVTFLGRGTVSGRVVDAGGNGVPNASLTLVSTDAFGVEAPVPQTADASGSFSFTGVPLGSFTISAHDPVTNQGGSATSQVGSNAQSVTLNVTITASANISGTVFLADGVTPVPAAFVTAQAGGQLFTTSADNQGRYTLAFVPLGAVTITARDAGTRGVGISNVTLSASGATVTANVIFLAQGSILVTATTATGQPLAGATVTVNALAVFPPDTQIGTTAADGTLLVDHVLAGSFSVNVRSGQLLGNVSGTISGGDLLRLTVPVQAAGSILGTVFQPDGQTPVSDARVNVTNTRFTFNVTIPVNADGTFRFDNVPFDVYTVTARDNLIRTRTIVTGVTIDTSGEVLTENLVFVGLGSVTGRVLNPDSSSAPNMIVQVQSLNPVYGGYFSSTSNAAGFYEVDSVPVGAFTVSTGDTTKLLLGEGSGTIVQDGQVVNADILLQSNAVSLPFYYQYDGNNFFFDVQPNGSAITGYSSYFAGDFGANYGTPLLDVISGGVAQRFTGATIGTFENHKQAIAIRQQGLAGLNVTRKVFVPSDGYFTRYQDILTNPTGAPITVSLRVTSGFRGYSSVPSLISTSSGDASLSVADPNNPDRWVIIDDSQDNDPYYNYGTPAAAIVFDGAGAPSRVASATFAPIGYPASQFQQTWTNVTVPAGGTVEYIYFMSVETSRAAAAEAAQRLSLVPPEALNGLSPADLQAVQNFVVPQDGIGAVAALPPLTGTITGHVYEVDGTTPVPNSTVNFTSGVPVFARQQRVFTNASGVYTLAGVVNAQGTTLAVPAGAFTMQVQHGVTGVMSQSVSGGFAQGQTSLTENVVFSGTTLVHGTVRRTSGAVVTSGTVQLAGNALPFRSEGTSVASDGTFQLGGVPAGSYTLTVTVSNSQGSSLVATQSLTVTAGQVLSVPVTMPATGTLHGIVTTPSGAPAANIQVRAFSTPSFTFSRTATTDTSGSYTLADLPVGPYEIDVSDSRTFVVVKQQVVINQDATTTANVVLPAAGNVHVQVNYARGVPAANSLVTINPGVKAGSSFFTDATGSVTIPNEQAGSFIVTGYYPNNTNVFAQSSGAIVNEGDSPLVTITLPAAGTISGQILYGNGSPGISASASLFSQGVELQTVYADGVGNFSFPGLTLGTPYSVTAARPYPNNNLTRTVSATPLTSDGQVETLNVTLPSVATVGITALRSDGTQLFNARVEWTDSTHQFFQFAGYTDGNGKFNLSNIPEGAFTVNLRDPQTFATLVQATGTVKTADEGSVIPFTIQLTVPNGSVRGTIVDAAGTPVPSAPVYVFNTRDTNTLTSTATAADGTYQTVTFQPGDQGFTVYAYTPNYSLNTSQAATFTSAGQVVTVNVTLPVLRGNVTGRVVGGDGVSPLSSVYVWLEAPDGSTLDSTYTDQNGAYTFTGEWLPSAGFTVWAQTSDTNTQASSQVLQITTAGQTINATVTVPVFTGTVSGTVFAGDGITPVQGAYIRLTGGGACGDECGLFQSTNTGDDGTYSFGPFTASSDGFVVTVSDPAFAQQTGTFTSEGQQVNLNLTEPVSVVKGAITYADGTLPALNSVNVFVTTSDSSTYYLWSLDASDRYVVFVPPTGSVTVTGQDGDSGLETSVNTTITSVDIASTVNLTLPADGTVGGHVLAADGTARANVTVTLTTSTSFQRYATTDANGAFSFAHVPLGAATVQAPSPSGTLTATTSIGAQGQIAAVTLSP